MKCSRLILVAGVLVLGGSLAAQTRVPSQNTPTEQVRTWYDQFLQRDLDRGATRWINDLRRGVNPDTVLANILSSREYFDRAGGNDEGYVRQLFDDFLGREPTREELRDWTGRLKTQKREAVTVQIIRGEGPAPPSPQPPLPQLPQTPKLPQLPGPGDADYFGELRAAIRRLHDQLDDLAEDIVGEFEDRRERDLTGRTEAVIADLHAFGRVARPGMPRERMVRAFNQLDRNLRALLDAVRRQAMGKPVLLRSAERVARASERLHLAFQDNVEPPPRPGPDFAREAEALFDQGKQLQRTTNAVLTDAGISPRIKRNLEQFVQRADSFRRSAKDGADLDRLRREFTGLMEPWGAAIRDINTLPPAGNFGLLRQQAQRVEQIAAWLQRQLGAKVETPYVTTSPPRR